MAIRAELACTASAREAESSMSSLPPELERYGARWAAAGRTLVALRRERAEMLNSRMRQADRVVEA